MPDLEEAASDHKCAFNVEKVLSDCQILLREEVNLEEHVEADEEVFARLPHCFQLNVGTIGQLALDRHNRHSLQEEQEEDFEVMCMVNWLESVTANQRQNLVDLLLYLDKEKL